MKTVYISGPMSTDKDYRQKFNRVEELLYKADFDVVNPVKLSDELEEERGVVQDSLPYGDYLKNDIKHLIECDYICMLPNYQKSAGAMLELHIALSLGIKIIFFENLNVNIDEIQTETDPDSVW